MRYRRLTAFPELDDTQLNKRDYKVLIALMFLLPFLAPLLILIFICSPVERFGGTKAYRESKKAKEEMTCSIAKALPVLASFTLLIAIIIFVCYN